MPVDSRAAKDDVDGPHGGRLRCPVCSRTFPADTEGCPDHPVTLVPADPLVGKVLAQTWRLDAPLGEGGTAFVYSARHITLPGAFAVKVLAPMRAKDAAQRERFLREAEAQAKVQHDNVTRVIEWGHDEKNDLWYVAMEHVKGDTLKDEIARTGPFPPARAVPIACQVLDALAAAHAVALLHRDLKPHNIMLTEAAGLKDRVRVLDFGGKPIERVQSDFDKRARTALTLPGTLFGTPAYMSPEQAKGEPLDERSDVYAAAVVLLHMLLGRSPFRGRDLSETLSRVLTMMPPRPSLMRKADVGHIPPGLEIVLMKALNKDPDLRFKSAAEFKDALLRFMGPKGPRGPRGPSPDDDGADDKPESSGELSLSGTVLDGDQGDAGKLRRLVDDLLCAA